MKLKKKTIKKTRVKSDIKIKLNQKNEDQVWYKYQIKQNAKE
jgi:hypothetical protein